MIEPSVAGVPAACGSAPHPGTIPGGVSIIIPVAEPNRFLRESVEMIGRLTAEEPGGVRRDLRSRALCEVIVLPDREPAEPLAGARIIPTGPVGPADKRDHGAGEARGEFLAFLDDDAYPSEDWLARALPHFRDPDVAAVGGPGLTPPDDGPAAQASGAVLASRLASGAYAYRNRRGSRRDVDDYPSFNLIVRRSDFEASGGFRSHYYPGEDTKLCLALTHRLGKRIVYEPDAYVYHHRRPLFRAHCRQVLRYAIHRGKFVREYPETSRRPAYFVPSAFLIGLIAGPAACALAPALWPIYGGACALYGAACIGTAARHAGRPRVALLTAAGLVATHVVYGAGFLWGLSRKELAR
ncbi:MAG: glycosyltransferase [Planctomycetes bacterium]|nr:glycosyltransferase [Planctomycetota bacterium]